MLDSRAASYHQSCFGFSWTGSQGVVIESRVSGFRSLRIVSLLFADGVLLLGSSSQDLLPILEWFVAECEAPRMRVSSSKSEAMVLNQKKGRMLSLGWE